MFGTSRPNLITIKKYWDIATNPFPDVIPYDKFDEYSQEVSLLFNEVNCNAEKELIKIVG